MLASSAIYVHVHYTTDKIPTGKNALEAYTLDTQDSPLKHSQVQ